ncbi:unnamed protein product [Caenorhabditis bovis]|uniref:Uncharacterized protein n=1 Tax=Caenorhabditis bovis TaxID=2654633 RepID=A0A8S1FG55_9PELO|nr:unnamed protein product [Caenorhabditis bovis]
MGAFTEMRHTQPSDCPQVSQPQRLRVDMGMQGLGNLDDSIPSSTVSANSTKPLLGRPLNRSPVRFDKNSTAVYMPTTYNGNSSQADSSESRRKHEKLAEVYSMSGDTVEFAKNLSDYINDRIPYQISVSILSLFSLLAFLLIIFGLLNLPFCNVQPMIPIWLIVEGILFIISATFRIYFLIPVPRKSSHRRRPRKMGSSLLCKGIEMVFALANLVWLILGCVWVYGSNSYVHFNEGMFESHYCEPTVYWAAFIACTTFLIFWCVIIVVLICLLAIGTCAEQENDDQILD